MLEGNMSVKPIIHEIRIQNQVIFLDPPIEYARSTWIKQLHDWLGERCLGLLSWRHSSMHRRYLPITPYPKFEI